MGESVGTRSTKVWLRRFDNGEKLAVEDILTLLESVRDNTQNFTIEADQINLNTDDLEAKLQTLIDQTDNLEPTIGDGSNPAGASTIIGLLKFLKQQADITLSSLRDSLKGSGNRDFSTLQTAVEAVTTAIGSISGIVGLKNIAGAQVNPATAEGQVLPANLRKDDSHGSAEGLETHEELDRSVIMAPIDIQAIYKAPFASISSAMVAGHIERTANRLLALFSAIEGQVSSDQNAVVLLETSRDQFTWTTAHTLYVEAGFPKSFRMSPLPNIYGRFAIYVGSIPVTLFSLDSTLVVI